MMQDNREAYLEIELRKYSYQTGKVYISIVKRSYWVTNKLSKRAGIKLKANLN